MIKKKNMRITHEGREDWTDERTGFKQVIRQNFGGDMHMAKKESLGYVKGTISKPLDPKR